MLSSLLRPPTGGRSIYETMKEDEEHSDASDPHDLTGMALDEANLQEQFHDQDLGPMLQDAAESQITSESTAFLGRNNARNHSGRTAGSARTRVMPKWMRQQRTIDAVLDEEEDVPESLLLEGERKPRASSPASLNTQDILPPPVPGPSDQSDLARWNTARTQQPLHDDMSTDTRPSKNRQARAAMLMADPKEMAMWRWTNVYNLDNFLGDVYTYYTHHGFWSIMLARFLNMLCVNPFLTSSTQVILNQLLRSTIAFVFTSSIFLLACVDYSEIPRNRRLTDVMIPQCTKK